MKKNARKPKKLMLDDVLTEILSIKATLGGEALKTLASRVDKLEELFNKLLQPDLAKLLGELRAVRILLDEKKQYKTMDTPAPKSDVPPVPERIF